MTHVSARSGVGQSLETDSRGGLPGPGGGAWGVLDGSGVSSWGDGSVPEPDRCRHSAVNVLNVTELYTLRWFLKWQI